MGLKFHLAEICRELIHCHQIAKKYLEPESRDKLRIAAGQLKSIPISTDRCQTWQIGSDNPLKVRCNEGYHELSGGGKGVQGRLSFIWVLRRINNRTIELVGNASTVVAIHEYAGSEVKDEPVLRWQVDVATSPDPPGPVFHIQIDNPEELPVPRFPSLLFSPSDCLDFLLGELLQKTWSQRQSDKFEETRRFAATQKSRFLRLLEAQRLELKNSGSDSSAWIALKRWEPDDEMFLKK